MILEDSNTFKINKRRRQKELSCTMVKGKGVTEA
jgi:hypothetical protein